MNTEKAIDKIRKLLALAQSDNAGEAENELLFARKLMAKYKLTERDVADAKRPGKLTHEVYEAYTFSDLVNTWMFPLCCSTEALFLKPVMSPELLVTGTLVLAR